MIVLERVPHGINEILEEYGTPYDDEGELDHQWYSENTEVFQLPFWMVLSWDTDRKIDRFRAHKKVGGAIVDAIAELGWIHRNDLRGKNLDRFGGVFNFRAKREGDKLSTHSWGIAIDLNPHIGKLGSVLDARYYPKSIVKVFERRGFEWGGRWDYPDAMQFQACTGY